MTDQDARESLCSAVVKGPLQLLDPSNPDLVLHGLQGPLFERLRRESPIHYCQSSAYGPFWSITRFKHVVEIEEDPSLFSSEQGFMLADIKQGDAESRSFMSQDPPRNLAVRRLILPMASADNLKSLQQAVAGMVDQLLDQLPFHEPFDWVEAVAVPLSMQVLALSMGVPIEDCDKLRQWSESAVAHRSQPDGSDNPEFGSELSDCYDYFMAHCRAMADQPEQMNFISRLVKSEKTKQLSDRQLFNSLIILLVGGNETTRHAVAASALLFDVHPDQRRLLYSNPQLLAPAMSEVVRLQTPLSYMRRTVTQDCCFDNHALKRGDKVVLWYASANRDEDQFDNPSQFRIVRANHDRHLAFGAGPHHCIGKHVALLELKLLWQRLIERGLTVRAIAEPKRVRSNFVNGFTSLPVEMVADR